MVDRRLSSTDDELTIAQSAKRVKDISIKKKRIVAHGHDDGVAHRARVVYGYSGSFSIAAKIAAERISKRIPEIALISFEYWRHGFLVTVAGQRLLWHTTRMPAVFVHRLGEMRSAWRGAGSCMPAMASGSSAQFTFSSKLVMREEFSAFCHDPSPASEHASTTYAAIFSLYFSSLDPAIDFVKLRFHDIPGAQWNGLGPRKSHAVKGRIALLQPEQTAAFALDGRFLQGLSPGPRFLSFDDGSFVLRMHLPAEVHIGYAPSPEEACSLWHAWSRKAHVQRAPAESSSPALPLKAPLNVPRLDARDGAGLLGSLSFSGAGPEAFQRLNLSIVQSAHGQEDWKIADLMLCQPDVTLPPGFRREIPPGLSVPGNRTRALSRYAKIRAGLVQYWEFCQRRWEETGLPALQHPSLSMPRDPVFAAKDDSLFSGPDLLFSPNLARTGDVCSCILPAGQWIHLWTSRVFPSGRVTVHAPFGMPAVFYRAEGEYAWLFDSIRQIASRL
jgi:hypothetical protein